MNLSERFFIVAHTLFSDRTGHNGRPSPETGRNIYGLEFRIDILLFDDSVVL
jgi:hypothetical protein